MWETITRNSVEMKKKAGTKKKAGNSSDEKRRPVDQWQIIGIGLHEKKEYRRLFNSYVANNVRFANRNSLDMAPPLACRALTMVRFPTKKCDDGLPG